MIRKPFFLWLIQWLNHGRTTIEVLLIWHSWGIVLIGLLPGVSFGFSLILSYKLRILAASVTSLSFPARVHSIPTALNYFPSTAAPLNSTDLFCLDFSVDWTLGE